MSKNSPQKLIFPESEYDVLEKRLINLESELQNAGDNEEFKRLCKMGVMCEERWAKLYCRDYNKPWESYRSEAISVLKHNLDIRRDGLRPFMKVSKGQGETAVRQLKRDVLTSSPSVSIISGRMNPPKDVMRGQVKRTYGTCVPINTVTTGYSYSYIQNDACYMIENDLFDVESRLKRCPPNTEEYNELIEEGRRLRELWRATAEEMKRKKSNGVRGYDLRKCVVVSKAKKIKDDIGSHLSDGEMDVDIQH